MSQETLIAILAIVVPVVVAMLGAAWKIAQVGARVDESIKTLSEAVVSLGDKLDRLNEEHAQTRERVARIEGGQNRGGN